MRTDLLFHKGSDAYQEAIHHLQELLAKKPGNEEVGAHRHMSVCVCVCVCVCVLDVVRRVRGSPS